MECKNKRFYKQAHVWPEREPPAVHSSGVETKAATPQTKKKKKRERLCAYFDWPRLVDPDVLIGRRSRAFSTADFHRGGGTKWEKQNAGRRCRLAVRV